MGELAGRTRLLVTHQLQARGPGGREGRGARAGRRADAGPKGHVPPSPPAGSHASCLAARPLPAGPTRLPAAPRAANSLRPPQFLPHADVIFVMEGGRVAHEGTYEDLIAAGVDLASYVPLPEASAGAEDGGVAAGAKGEAAPPALEQAQPSITSAVELPAGVRRALTPGGSFASHAPSRLGDAPRPGAAAASRFAAVDEAAAEAVAAADAAGGDVEAPERAQELDAGAQLAADIARVKSGCTDVDDGAGDDDDDEDGGGGAKGGAGAKGAGGKDAGAEPGAAAGGAAGALARLARRGRLVKAENRARGRVKRSVYLAYVTAWGPFFIMPIVILLGAGARSRFWAGGGGGLRPC
jgi:hypothetical protein